MCEEKGKLFFLNWMHATSVCVCIPHGSSSIFQCHKRRALDLVCLCAKLWSHFRILESSENVTSFRDYTNKKKRFYINR